MKATPGNEEFFYSMIEGDGFWYALSSKGSIKSKEDLCLESDDDAIKVIEAIKILKDYEAVCEVESEAFTEFDEGDDDEDGLDFDD